MTDKSITKKVIEIAVKFEDALRIKGESPENDFIQFRASDIYFLLCQLMPDPSTILWEKQKDLDALPVWGSKDG